MYDPGDFIEIEVLDLNAFTGPDFLGQVRVPLSSLPHLQHHSDWYKLEPRPGEDVGFRITGSLQMSLLCAHPCTRNCSCASSHAAAAGTHLL